MTTAVILAAGTSVRFSESCPQWWQGERRKVHLEVAPGVPLWRLSFDVFRQHPEIDSIGVVCTPGEEAEFSIADFVIPGGETRRDSSLAGVRAAARSKYVLVHDAARPFVSSELVSRVVAATREHGAAIPAVAVSDTVKRGTDVVEETIDRNGLNFAQTPQGSRRDWLVDALERHPGVTDESAALEADGHTVHIVPGDQSNLKVTHFSDFQATLDVVMPLKSVTGFGYDIHPFATDSERKLMLGGVHFEDENGLEGHSDADVVLHAITDAILGAIGEGDIGQLFPDTDPNWKDADSAVFLRQAGDLVRSKGGVIASIDSTVVAEKPKIGEKRKEMRQRIANILGIDQDCVNVKATTNEKLGSIGQGQGIAAFAVATIYVRKHN
jgi:2-C-methyl-D-erythritol 4-phosphate cytidylyltransferase/2-C-methyl-D-erythritol 2,4-cyclodiphosphate synthase